jgi:outer membrane protein assembly factor BamD (BamD/ComL family)
MKKAIVIVALLLTALFGYGCSDKAQELYETAQFEELQKNKPHAVKLYREIINEYPESEYVSKAREQLEKLEMGK